MPEPEVMAAAIARNLRKLRADRGWTLDGLAGRCGVSKGMLVQIEQARTNPSIGTLCRVADGLGVALARLVEVAEESVVRVVHQAEVAELWRGNPGSCARLLVGSDPPALLELWEWSVAAGDAYAGDAHHVGTREIVHVLTGGLLLEVAGEEHRLAAGDTALFTADRPHRYANPGPGSTRFVLAVSQPDLAAAPSHPGAPSHQAGVPAHPASVRDAAQALG